VNAAEAVCAGLFSQRLESKLMRTSKKLSLRPANARTSRIAPKGVSQAAWLMALSLLAGTASGQWSVTILSPDQGNGFSRANCVFGNTQGGSIDDGYQEPLVWQGSAATQTLLPFQLDTGCEVNGISATHAAGSGYFRTSEFDGFYTGVMWNLSTLDYTLINVPGSFESAINGISGNAQVGNAYINDDRQPVLWRGTSESWQSLLPDGYIGGDCYAIDGNVQVGELYDGITSIAALWNGSAASFVSLHPLAWDESYALAVSQALQAGSVYRSNNDVSEEHAAVWSGSAESFIDLHPPCAQDSEATGISMGRVVGNVRLSDESESDIPVYWPNFNSTEFVNLFELLPVGQYISAYASAIWTDGDGVVYIVGSADNLQYFSEAVMWTFTGGGCVVGNTHSIVPNAAACAGTYLGAGRYFGTVTGCCLAALDSDEARNDKDGDFIIDSCATVTPENDCNSNGVIDSIETLDFNSYFDQSDWSTHFVANPTASFTPENTVELTPASGGLVGTIVSTGINTLENARISAIFDFRIDQTENFPGDGISFNILNAAMYGTDPAFGEDGPGTGAITVKFNTFANSVEEGDNSMELLYNGALIQRVTTLPLTLVSDNWRRVIFNLSVDGKVTVKLATNSSDVATVFDQVQLPAYSAYPSVRTAFGARTGAGINRQSIRNFHLGFSNLDDVNGDGLPNSCSGPTCFADYNQDGGIDGSDIEAFFIDWEAGSASADTNEDGGVDGSDVEIFFLQWEAGGC